MWARISIYLFLLFRAGHVAYGSSQTRGLIRATAAGLYHSHSNTRSKPCPQPTPKVMKCQILNLLSKSKNRTHVLMDTSRVCKLLGHNRSSACLLNKIHSMMELLS